LGEQREEELVAMQASGEGPL